MNDPILNIFIEIVPFTKIFLLIVVFTFILFYVGNKIIRRVLSNRKPSDWPSDNLNNGRMIGILERLMVFLAIIIQQWTLIAIVVALKTIARYSALDGKEKSEYFLIGSMFSLLWAIVLGLIFVFIIKEIEYFEELKFILPDKVIEVKII